MRERRLALPVESRQRASVAACDRLLALFGPGDDLAGKVVAAYIAVRGEIDPGRAVEGLRARGARIALPRAEESWRREVSLSFECVDRDTPLRPGKFGIPEPSADALVSVRPGALDIVIAPGLAFDSEGRRLGSGGGYYDRTFDRWHHGRPALLVGFGYDFQIVDRCPADDHDVAVDLIVTPERVIGPRPPRESEGAT